MNKSTIKVTPLGSGSEVGRSCILCEFDQTPILFDCGTHPAYTGIESLPYLDIIDLTKVKAIFITHFHLDHAGALPYLTEKTNFQGRVFMTQPTKAILKFLLNDYIRIVNASSSEDFYTEQDLLNCYDRIECIDFHQEVTIENLKIKALNAGHVLGAAMFQVTHYNKKLLYTGDFSREEDRHLKTAESPPILDILITESTYGLQCHLPRKERERVFVNSVGSIVKRGGHALLPVFALGRAQELLIILDEHWKNNANLQRYPIFYASALAERCLGIYQAYVTMMNDRIIEQSKTRNPFKFTFVKNIIEEREFLNFHRLKGSKQNTLKEIHDLYNNPSVVMASPAMLQSGFSRLLFDMWCSDKRNGVIIPGYVIPGTLAKEVLGEPKYIETFDGIRKPFQMSVDYISFSAHVDYLQNSSFVRESGAKHIFLVHGEAHEMARLKQALEKDWKSRNSEIKSETKTLPLDKSDLIDEAVSNLLNKKDDNKTSKKTNDVFNVYTLKNGQTKVIEFEIEKTARIINCHDLSKRKGPSLETNSNDIEKGEKKQKILLEGIFFKGEDIKIINPLNIDLETDLKLCNIQQETTFHFEDTLENTKTGLKEYYNLKMIGENKYLLDDIQLEFSEKTLKVKWTGNYQEDILVYSIKCFIGEKSPSIFSAHNKLRSILEGFFDLKIIDEKSFTVLNDGMELEVSGLCISGKEKLKSENELKFYNLVDSIIKRVERNL
ncbi:Cleavage and polyadenylation specificity factor subunit 3 [Cucumispora dikerogammari]|nr:Cleavage and polyadenylation specificity factor subunit 3 [Cucumispora dikerogammari]